MRIAFYGGTFDPPHSGHLAVALAAAERFHLDRVLFAPVGRQPLKPAAPEADYESRLAMVALLCQANASFEASRLDAPREDGQPNYTVDALAALRASLEEDAALFCIVGADSFLDLRRWRDPERLLQLAEWIVVSRPGFSLDDLRPLALTHEQSSRVHLLTDVDEPVSSTVIREALHRGQQPAVLPASVAEYIRAHGLYRG